MRLETGCCRSTTPWETRISICVRQGWKLSNTDHLGGVGFNRARGATRVHIFRRTGRVLGFTRHATVRTCLVSVSPPTPPPAKNRFDSGQVSRARSIPVDAPLSHVWIEPPVVKTKAPRLRLESWGARCAANPSTRHLHSTWASGAMYMARMGHSASGRLPSFPIEKNDSAPRLHGFSAVMILIRQTPSSASLQKASQSQPMNAACL
jgi:hypothetical protein